MEALKICDGLGLRGDSSIVGYGKQGQIVIIREGNIKMITIQSDAASSIERDVHEHATLS
jgi:ribosomal protein L30E